MDRNLHALLWVKKGSDGLDHAEKKRFLKLDNLYGDYFNQFHWSLLAELQKIGYIEYRIEGFRQDESGDTIDLGKMVDIKLLPSGREVIANPAYESESETAIEREREKRRTKRIAMAGLVLSVLLFFWEIIKRIFPKLQ